MSIFARRFSFKQLQGAWLQSHPSDASDDFDFAFKWQVPTQDSGGGRRHLVRFPFAKLDLLQRRRSRIWRKGQPLPSHTG